MFIEIMMHFPDKDIIKKSLIKYYIPFQLGEKWESIYVGNKLVEVVEMSENGLEVWLEYLP